MKILDSARRICGKEDPLMVLFDLENIQDGQTEAEGLRTAAGRRIAADTAADVTTLRSIVGALANRPHTDNLTRTYGPHWRMILR